MFYKELRIFALIFYRGNSFSSTIWQFTLVRTVVDLVSYWTFLLSEKQHVIFRGVGNHIWVGSLVTQGP